MGFVMFMRPDVRLVVPSKDGLSLRHIAAEPGATDLHVVTGMAFDTNVNGGRRFLHDRDLDYVWWGRPAPMHLFLGQYAMGEYDVRCSDVWRDCSLESPTRTGPPIPEGFRSEASNLGLQA